MSARNVRNGIRRLAGVLGGASLVSVYVSLIFGALKAHGAVTWCMYTAGSLFALGVALLVGDMLYEVARWVIDGFKGR